MKKIILILVTCTQILYSQEVSVSQVLKIQYQLSDNQSFTKQFGFDYLSLKLVKNEYIEKVISSKDKTVYGILVNVSIAGGNEFSRCLVYKKNDKSVTELSFDKNNANWISNLHAINSNASKMMIEVAKAVDLKDEMFFVNYSTVVYSIENMKISEVTVEDLLSK